MLFVAATLGRSATLLLRRPPPRLARAAMLCVRAGPDPPPNAGSQTLEALRACSKRGRFKIALELLARLEAEALGEPLPAIAWHSALAACRKRERKEEALELLERMGAAADTHAHNEVLHTLRRTFDYDAAMRVWASLRAPDSSSYYHLLVICGETGRWAEAAALLEGMGSVGAACGKVASWSCRSSAAWPPQTDPPGAGPSHALERGPEPTRSPRGGGCGAAARAPAKARVFALSPPTQAGLPLGVGHYKMALRACTRDRRWEAASALLHRVPPAMWEADVALCRNGLKACAEAAEPQLAARLVAVLGRSGGLGPDEYAWWLQACRVAGDAAAAGEAWAAYRASGGAPSELCYALRLGILYDLGEDDEALALGREAVAALPADNAQLVANAAVGCAVKNANYAVSSPADDNTAAITTGVARAREAMALRRACGAPPMAGAQVRVLQVCLAAAEWAALVEELGLAQAAGYAAAMTEDELRVLRRVCEQAEQAVEAEGAVEGATEHAAVAEGSAAAASRATRAGVALAEDTAADIVRRRWRW